MVVPDKSDPKVEHRKAKLGLTGDVYIVDHHMESLASHKILFPESNAHDIYEAEVEYKVFTERRLEELKAAEAAKNNAETE